MLRLCLASLLASAMLAASPASALAPPVVIDDGSGGVTCRWNPYAEIKCNGPNCWWVGRYEWFDPIGNSTGERCT